MGGRGVGSMGASGAYGYKVSISATFYEHLFCTSALRSFSQITVWHVIFWQKNIDAKDARKMLMKLTKGASADALYECHLRDVTEVEGTPGESDEAIVEAVHGREDQRFGKFPDSGSIFHLHLFSIWSIDQKRHI